MLGPCTGYPAPKYLLIITSPLHTFSNFIEKIARSSKLTIKIECLKSHTPGGGLREERNWAQVGHTEAQIEKGERQGC